MDGVHARFTGDAQDVADVEISIDGALAGAHLVGLVRLGAVEGETIFVRIDRDGAQPELGRRAHDANGDLAAVCDQ